MAESRQRGDGEGWSLCTNDWIFLLMEGGRHHGAAVNRAALRPATPTRHYIGTLVGST